VESLRPAVASRKHIFCEKPLALNQVMADEIRALLEGYSKPSWSGKFSGFFGSMPGFASES
jgi:hypothetical protein